MKPDLNRAVHDNFAEKVAAVARALPTIRMWEGEGFTAMECGLPSAPFDVVVVREVSLRYVVP